MVLSNSTNTDSGKRMRLRHLSEVGGHEISQLDSIENQHETIEVNYESIKIVVVIISISVLLIVILVISLRRKLKF